MEQLKWGIDKSTLKVGDYNPPSLAIDETSRQRKSVGIDKIWTKRLTNLT